MRETLEMRAEIVEPRQDPGAERDVQARDAGSIVNVIGFQADIGTTPIDRDKQKQRFMLITDATGFLRSYDIKVSAVAPRIEAGRLAV